MNTGHKSGENVIGCVHHGQTFLWPEGPELPVAVREIPKQVSRVVFDPFHLTGFKDNCIMVVFRRRKKQH